LLVHGNYKSSLVYFCVYMTKETVSPSQLVVQRCQILSACFTNAVPAQFPIMKPDSGVFSNYTSDKIKYSMIYYIF
jgi:hypothetical protein